MNKLILIGTLLILSNLAFAGNIRSIEVSSKKMEYINLKLGQSTVLRFKETPKKVVIGNQNYFNIEFVGSDITIQPQAQVKTNLFVYGEYHTFGFILNVGSGGSYDDLVNISWEAPMFVTQKKSYKLLSKSINKKIRLKDGLECSLDSLKELKKDFFVLDFTIRNNSKNKLSSQKLDTFLSRSKIKLPKQRLIFSGNQIESGLGIKGRLFFELNERKGFTFHVTNGDDQSTTIISRGYLL
ncbi:MAG: hypothetical protein COW01_15960 [Bdellovibrionales bacterium CG12_big_fil_rev_8_21_14_0_65_38_15]|nr:MAG: hypothetical protein COW79_15125 [Bdellovibrionales bacterium CG22_combo_CG10-13_8_21_14_all_38_13]PIQ52464.1 MAG: hypothetical protein COW01_15960 [Bdellovibrionales bacterium CG12_big_fil_rev_8_21_14_0_65_38_15]PIR29502.1 MAG: hypothetical protein COV38_10500 [Bdellovibrionales bacterium CG11_big_fil_rev_8_21_14_0_20_38_13]